MNYSERKVSPIAQEIFEDSFVPYIVDAYKSIAKISYLSAEEAKNWRSSKYNAYIKASILHATEMYFWFNFAENDKVLSNAKVMDDLTTLMAQYLTPYFAKAANAPAEADVYKNLKQKLYNENTFLNKIKEHERSERKRAKRQRAKARNKANLIAIKIALAFINDLNKAIIEFQETKRTKSKRARFIRYPNGTIQPIYNGLGNFKKQVKEFRENKQKQK